MKRSLLFLVVLVSSVNNICKAQNYQSFRGTGTPLTGSNWTASSPTNACVAGPYTSSFTAGRIAYFCVVGGTASGAGGITVGGIIATENLTYSSPSGTLATGGTVATVNVATGKTLDLSSLAISTAAGTGFIKTGDGVFALTGGTYAGGFTLNSGTLIARGVNAMGSGGALAINGGTIAANANRDLTGKYTGGITIGGDFTLGATTGLASSAANLTFSNNMALGTGTSRTITIGGTGNYTLGGIISGTGSNLTIGSTAAGTITLTGANTFSGLTTVNGGTLNLNRTGGTTLPIGNSLVVGSGATVIVSTTQELNNVTVDAGGTLIVAATLTISGTATINGNFQINQGGFANTTGGGTWTYGSSAKLVYNNTALYGPIDAGHTYWPATNGPRKVTVQNSGGINMGLSRTVADSFQTAAGVQGTALNLDGIAQINAGGFFSTTPVYGSSSTLVYNSGGTYGRGGELTTGTGIPANITINSGSSLDYGNGATGTARTITGNLTVAGGFFMDFGSNDMTQALTVNGNVTISGTLSLSDASGGDIQVGGNWTNTGTFNPKSRAVFFINSTGSLISGTGGANFDFLIINKTGGAAATLASNATVNNTLTLTAGNLSIAANTLTLNAAVSRTAGFLAGGNTSNLTIGGTAGSLHFDNTGTNNYLKAFTINTGASATLATNLNITSYDGTSSEGVLTVNGTGVLTTGGLLTIKSSANGTGRIAQGNTAGGYISGNVTVERFIPLNSSKGWRLLASNTNGSQSINAAWQEGQANSLSDPNPGFGTQISSGNALGNNLAAAQSAGFDTLSAGVSLFKYNPATDLLESVTNTLTTALSSEPGYFIFIRGDRRVGGYGAGSPTASSVLRSTGAVFQGDQAAVSTGAQNYGLVRNPYASRIDMRNIARGTNLIDAFQVWDAKLGGSFGVGGFQTFSKSGSDYIVTPGGGSYGSNGSVHNFIESGAAFFIQSVSNTNNTAQVVEACKTSASNTNSFRPSTPAAGEGRLVFNLYANNPGGSVDLVDGGLAYFANEYSNSVDIHDVRKSLNFNENFGMKRANTDLVVERRQQANLNDTVFFHMTQVRQISYRLDIEATNMDPLLNTAILQDKYTNTNTTLDLSSVNAYTFTVDANAASRAADRFRIVFRQSGVVPVAFISIKAAQAGNAIAVEWKVANEVNTVRYEVEKSTDGRNFSKKGTVIARGADTYNWLDENAVNGFNYYRIKSVDNSGQVKYTQVVKVQLGGKAGITISPNPVQGNFVNILINEPLAGKYGIRLTNIAGQAVYNKEVTHNGGSASQSFVLPSALSRGVYQLEVIAPDNTRQVEKLIIQGN